MGSTSVPCTSISQELNSHRKNALTVCAIVTASAPTSSERKPWSTAYRLCMGSSGRKFMTMVSGPMVSARAKTSYGSTAFCRCISISPESS